MRLVLLAIVFLVSVGGAIGQSKAAESTLVLEFSPAFIKESTLVFHKGNKKSFAELTVFEDKALGKVRFKETMELTSDSSNKLFGFFNGYKFRIKGSQDTVGVEKYVNKRGDTVVDYVVTEGLDGITVTGALTSGSKAQKFAFWSPSEGTDNYRLMHIVFSMLNGRMKKPESITYMKALQGYFH